jgi:pilus assembly protein CpaE
VARLGSEGRTILRVAVVGENEQERAAINAALSAISDPPLEIVEIALQTGATDDVKPDVAMVIFDDNGAVPLGYLQAQSERSPHPVLFALLRERSPDLMRRVLHAGADEMLFLPLDSGAITRAMLKLTEARRKNERGDGGAIYSVMSLAGGVGATTLSANLALALRYVLGKRAAVVDLDLQNGGLSVYLRLNSEQTIIPLIEFGRNLDSINLEAALTKHASGIYLLAAPNKIEDCELVSDMTVATVLDLMRRLFDFVVVDCGRQ